MTDAEQQQELVNLINYWCPEQFACEPLTSRLMRAMMHCQACAMDQRRIIQGELPIRPLSDYPNPLNAYKA